MDLLLAMKNSAGVAATLIATEGDDPTSVQLVFRVVAPGQPPRDEPFGPERKANATEILDLIDGLRAMLAARGFISDVEEEKHGVIQ
jgi:hypothetical protein